MMPVSLTERTSEQGLAPFLVERRRAGEVFPRIPVGSVELTREQAAAGLFTQLKWLPVIPQDWELLAVLDHAVTSLGVDGLEALYPEVAALPELDRDASKAFGYAYRLCVEHWYEGATSDPIDPDLMGVALYASDLPVQDPSALAGLSAVVDGHMAEGIARLGTERLVALATGMELEFGPSALDPSGPGFKKQWKAYRAAMPDRERRVFCDAVAVSRCSGGPRPLMVWFETAEMAVGITPPPNPHGQELQARWQARIDAVREGRA
ncbi:hypothetical protein ACFXKR_20550 [Streptomyces violascens]|uniref:hypothetical protein n=1 Tax=Streptomyces violascens TaxID=67381 RepID=UPI0036BD9A75